MAGTGAEEKPHFYQRHPFQTALAILTFVATAWALIGIPTPWRLIGDAFSDELPLSNTEIILDVSSGMRAPYEGGTKLDAAVDAIEDFVRPLSNEGLALRRAGSECDSSGELLVDFDESQGDEVVDAAASQSPRGASNLVYAIIAGIDDFADAERFGRPGARNRLLVVTGAGSRICLPSGTGRVSREIERSGVEAVLSLVSLSSTPASERRVMSLANALSQPAPPAGVLQAEGGAPRRPGKGVCAHPGVECPQVAAPQQAQGVLGIQGGSTAHGTWVDAGGLVVEVHFPRNDRELAEVMAEQRGKVLAR